MAKNLLDTARKYLKKREFLKVINLLEPHILEYRQSFQFYYILGVACLYQGDISGCEEYFQSARHIKMNDVNLILGQAVLFLKKFRIEKAIEYCVDAINLEPENPYAKKLFLNTKTRMSIKWKTSKKETIESIHPPLEALTPPNPALTPNFLAP